MKVIILTTLLFAHSVSVSAQSVIKLEIGSKLPAKYTKKTNRMIMTAAAQMFPFVEVTLKKVTYKVAFDADNRKVKYIVTSDKDFVGTTGLKIGQEITVKYEDILVYDYFQLRLKADKNGWQVILGGGFNMDRDLIDRIEKDGQFKTTIEAFAKGYNY